MAHQVSRGEQGVDSERRKDILEELVFVNDLYAMFIVLAFGTLAYGGKVGVHHQRGRGRMFGVGWTGIAIHLESGHGVTHCRGPEHKTNKLNTG